MLPGPGPAGRDPAAFTDPFGFDPGRRLLRGGPVLLKVVGAALGFPGVLLGRGADHTKS